MPANPPPRPVAVEAAAAAEPVQDPPRLGGGPRWAVIGIFLLLLIFGMAFARAFLMPVVLAFLLTMVFSPVRRFLDRRGLASGVSASLIVGMLTAGLLAGVFALAAPVSGWVDRAPMIGYELREKLAEFRFATDGLREAAEQVDGLTAGTADPEVQRVVIEDTGNAMAVAMTVPTALAQLLFTLVLLFFLLSSGDMVYEKIVHVLPTFKDKLRAIRIAHDIERKLSRYLSTIALINAGLGVSIGLAMWWLGMPNPVLFGVIGFLFNFIPYLGAVMGVLIATSVGIVSLENVGDAFLAGAVFLALTSIEGQFVTPYFVGRSLQLNTVVVFLSVTLFAWLWSVAGMLVATPLLVMVRTFCEHIPSMAPVGDFLSVRGAEREVPPDD